MLTLAFKGKSEQVALAELSDELSSLYEAASRAFGLSLEDTALKLIAKGKTLPTTGSIEATALVKPDMKLMVMASKRIAPADEPKSDPTVRGFEREDADAAKRCLEVGRASEMSEWGRVKLGEYRCCRLEPCTWQSFGTRAGSSTPHAFEARKMLLKLSTDPAVLRILAERRWVVGALGEMDPVDDRLAEKTHSQGKCLLGYNTNHGARIDVRLRSLELDGFMRTLSSQRLEKKAAHAVAPCPRRAQPTPSWSRRSCTSWRTTPSARTTSTSGISSRSSRPTTSATTSRRRRRARSTRGARRSSSPASRPR